MAVLLVGLAVMGILMSVAMPAWRKAVQREKEEELVFRGQQYARAIGLYQRKFAGGFPPSIDLLVEQRFLRRKYVDPMTKDGEFQLLYQLQAPNAPGQGGATASRTLGGTATAMTPTTPQQSAPGMAAGFGQGTVGPRGGIIGVASKSTEPSMRLYNGRSRYNEWQFVYTAVSSQIGAPGGAQPGGVPGTGRPGMPTGPGGKAQPTSPFGTGSGFGRPGGSGTQPTKPPVRPPD